MLEQQGAYTGSIVATSRTSTALSTRTKGSRRNRNVLARMFVKGSSGCPRFVSSITNHRPYTAGRNNFNTRLTDENGSETLTTPEAHIAPGQYGTNDCNIQKKIGTTSNRATNTIIPIIPLIRLLAKANFCNGLGHPISKPVWADSSDFDIIDRFLLISRNLSHYYNGSSKKKSLYRIKYILRLSCIKTLARKHKSTVRVFLKRLGSELLEEFFTEEEEILSLIFPRASSTLQRLYRGRIWYLDISYFHQ